MKRTLCVITGARSEYGLMRPLMEAIRADGHLRLRVIVTGSHLSSAFGMTYREIEGDGFSIDAKVKILGTRDTPVALACAMGRCTSGIAQALQRIEPDVVVVMGDRYEMLAAVSAALICRIPVAHFSGGELTQGSFDDAIRHAITKMSHLHFTSTREYRRRVIQLGEDPRRVFKVGEIGLCDLPALKYLSRRQLEDELNIIFQPKNMLITFHPATGTKGSSVPQLMELLKAMAKLDSTLLIFTQANADTEGRQFNKIIAGFVRRHSARAVLFPSLGRLKYLSLLRQVDAVVGNSSSGLVEAPSFKVPTINIGDRQQGRIKAASVVDVPPRKAAIAKALAHIHQAGFQERLRRVVNPYGDGRGVSRALKILKCYPLQKLVQKKFYDVRFL